MVAAPTRTINDFAPELLQLVLHRVKQDSLAAKDGTIVTIVDALLVCKLWNKIATPLLYTDICLTGRQLVKYVRQSHPSSELTRSLTIVLSPIDWAEHPWVCNNGLREYGQPRNKREIWMSFYFAAHIFYPMKNLQSFSLTVLPDMVDHRNSLSDLPLYEVIRSLPASVRNLELEMGEFMSCTEVHEEPHLCPLLRKLLQRLTSVRLRLPKICEDIFKFSEVERQKSEASSVAGPVASRIILIHAVSLRLDRSSGQCSQFDQVISRGEQEHEEQDGEEEDDEQQDGEEDKNFLGDREAPIRTIVAYGQAAFARGI